MSRERAQRRRGAGGAALLVCLALGCTLPPWARRPPAFPSSPAAWQIPLYEPLTALGPRVLATVVGRSTGGRPPPSQELLFTVDSGSTHSAVPRATFERLGLDVTTSYFAYVEDARAVSRAWAGAVVPELRLGDLLTVHDVVASVQDGVALLGADILAAQGWQIDLDRGTLVLGAAPWPAGPDVVAVPTRGWRGHSIVDLRIDQTPVPLLLDTGALVTVINRARLQRLGLREHPLSHPFPVAAAGGVVTLASAFDGDVGLGDRDLGQRAILAHPGTAGGPGDGLLGQDLLSRYAFQTTASGLKLRPRRAALAEGAAARIARWPDLPRCPGAIGCVAVTTGEAPADGASQARLRVRLLASFPRAERFLFGCGDVDAQGRTLNILMEVGIRHPDAGTDLTVGPEAAPVLHALWRGHCQRPVLLDVNPVIPDRPLGADVEARFTFESRGVTIK